MKLRDIIVLAANNTFRSKTKSILTALSITIGVISVILISSIGISGSVLINKEIERTGLRGVSVYKTDNTSGVHLLDTDAEKLMRRFKNIEKTLPLVIELGSVKMNKEISESVLFGVGEGSDIVYNVNVLYGRVPNASDVKGKRLVAVVDDELANKAYKRTNVVGKKIKINFGNNSDLFEIIGVISSQKSGINKLFGSNMPDFVYLPYSSLNELRQSDELTQIAIKCTDNDNSGTEFAEYLSSVNGAKGGYMAENMSTRIEEMKSLTELISLLITAISAISLCVAGIGIMNTMFSSTYERSREIGVCIAIGATRRDILLLFFFESIIISLFGGSIGAALGILITMIFSDMLNIAAAFNFKMFLIAEMISLLCGSIFSIIPAIKAANMDPIVALRRR